MSNNDNPLIDEDGHGTMVAGIIGARGNNAEDYYTTAVGVCWDVNMVSLKVLEYDEDEDDYIAPITRVIQAINYANQVGIDVLNYSVGSYNLSSQLESLTQAIQNYSGLFVCAAGNDALNTDNYPHYPSSIELPNLISVAACHKISFLVMMFVILGGGVSRTQNSHPLHKKSHHSTHVHVRARSRAAAEPMGEAFSSFFSFSLLSSFCCVTVSITAFVIAFSFSLRRNSRAFVALRS